MKRLAVTSMALVLGLCASSHSYAISAETGGALIGGVLGGVAGSQFGSGSGKTAATIGGVVIGAFVGSQVGKSLNKNQQRSVERAWYHALQRAMNSGRTQYWNSQGVNGRVIPGRIYQTRRGPACGNFSSVTYARDGGAYRNNGKACQDYNGYWRVR